MNNTPTPKTDAIPWIPNPIFYNSDLDLVRYVRIKEVRQLERELTAVTEQRDGLARAIIRFNSGTCCLPYLVDLALQSLNQAAVKGGADE